VRGKEHLLWALAASVGDNLRMSLASAPETPVLPKSDFNLVWLDCEMTGLNPEHDRIIEIAVVVTNAHLDIRVQGPVFAIHQSEELLAGLEAEAQLIAFLQKYVPKGKVPLCGNSIGQDRRFLARYMPKLEAYLHYRNVDVSTLKELARRWKPEVVTSFKKAQRHTALADVLESIDELQHYRTHFLALPAAQEEPSAAAVQA
jgi:oligoribonuclease